MYLSGMHTGLWPARPGSGTFEVTGPSDYSHIGSIGNTGSRLIKKRLEKIMVRFKKAYSPQELFDSIKSYQ